MAEKVAGQRLVIWFAVAFVAAAALFISITVNVMTGDYLARLGQSLYQSLRGMRTPLQDNLLIAVTMLGDAAVTVPVTLIAVAWLLIVKRDRQSGLFLAATASIAFLLVTAVKQVTQIPRPLDIYGGAVHYAFPSSHAAMSLVIYGFLALLCSRELARKRQWLPFVPAVGLILAIGYSRLYLGAHWLADVAGGFSLGTAWLLLMTLVFFRVKKPCKSQGLIRVVLLACLLAATFHLLTGFATNRLRYQQPQPVHARLLIPDFQQELKG
jgi:undecaprenyl-diphosphatase